MLPPVSVFARPGPSAVALSGLFVGAGVMHFVAPGFYVSILPSAFPAPGVLVLVTGLLELAGGVGLWVPKTRFAAAVCLTVFLVGVWPLHVVMALDHVQPDWPLGEVTPAGLWARVVLQAPLVAWAALTARALRRSDPANHA